MGLESSHLYVIDCFCICSNKHVFLSNIKKRLLKGNQRTKEKIHREKETCVSIHALLAQ